MSKHETATSHDLPAPVALTVEELRQVAAGSVGALPTALNYIIYGGIRLPQMSVASAGLIPA